MSVHATDGGTPIITIIMYDLLETLCGKVSGCVEGANNSQMKEIRGLGDRLSGLEQLLLDAKRKVKKITFLPHY